ncbi:hypothetical protein AZI86_09335 [Bdellovibrio bacteriovorus]|uniref:Collagen-like surface protein n=1 Tax=Bdellovibrio bacteriovorus TaxID=959 RepID=A0A150WRR2_BDEBC|nr:hypothetical protein [Bdellovibrio bacteriovorus]KYG67201.1 hypothetical protein AZI86_09335 [Bdellovibrio bacteriovorus]
MKKTLLLLCALASLSACVEIKDPNQETKNEPENVKPVVLQQRAELVVDKDIYFFEGDFLTKEEFIKMEREPSLAKDHTVQLDYLQIEKGAVLYTLGQNLRLEVKELSSNGKIETFPEGAQAPLDIEGRSGGIFYMIVDQGEGFLEITMRGQQGGNGSDGAEPDAALVGEPGKLIQCKGCSEVEVLKTWLGGKGKRGYPGADGKTGGSSGSLKFTIKSYDHFVMVPHKYGGRGGNKGRGNPRGGDPGPPAPVGLGYLQSNTRYPELYKTYDRYGGPGADGVDGKEGTVDNGVYDDKGQRLPI